jgi:hypothetical protein
MRIFATLLLAVMLSGCGATAPLVLSGVGGALTIAKDVIGLDVSIRDLEKAKHPEQCPPTP